jgi:hypothetical protein
MFCEAFVMLGEQMSGCFNGKADDFRDVFPLSARLYLLLVTASRDSVISR